MVSLSHFTATSMRYSGSADPKADVPAQPKVIYPLRLLYPKRYLYWLVTLLYHDKVYCSIRELRDKPLSLISYILRNTDSAIAL